MGGEIWIKIQIKLFKLLKENFKKIISVEIPDLLIPKQIPQLLKILYFLATEAVFLDWQLPALCSAPARLGGSFSLPLVRASRRKGRVLLPSQLFPTTTASTNRTGRFCPSNVVIGVPHPPWVPLTRDSGRMHIEI